MGSFAVDPSRTRAPEAAEESSTHSAAAGEMRVVGAAEAVVTAVALDTLSAASPAASAAPRTRARVRLIMCGAPCVVCCDEPRVGAG